MRSLTTSMKLRHVLFAGAAVGAVPGHGFAQPAAYPGQPSAQTRTAATSASAPAAPAGTLGEIVVTAQKREQSINKVGMTITAATGAVLAARGVTNVADLEKIVPGFKASESIFETPVYTLRGIGLNDYSLGSTPAVAVYQDQVPLPYPTMYAGVGLDVQRVEVLKGPQGTLFGQSSTGGAINYIPNQPTNRFQAGADLSYDSYSQVDATGFLSGPLTDTLKGRIVLEVVEGGAWQKNTAALPGEPSESRQRLGDARKVTGRAILDWRPTQAFKANLSVTVNQDRSDVQATQFTSNYLNIYGSPSQAAAAGEAPISQDPYAVVNPAAFAALTTPGSPAYNPTFLSHQALAFSRAAAGQGGGLDYLGGVNPGNNATLATWNPNFPQARDEHFYSAALRLDYKLSELLTATSITSYSQKDNDFSFDNSATDDSALLVRIYGPQRYVSEEARIAADTSTIHALAGVAYDHSNVGDNFALDFPDSAISEPIPGLTFNDLLSQERQHVDNYGAFGNIEYAVTSSLKVTGGVRYNESDRKASLCNSDPAYDTSQDQAQVFSILSSALRAGAGLPAEAPVTIAPGQCFTLNTTSAPTDPAFLRPTIAPTSLSLREHNVPWHVGVDYALPQGTLLYATISKGYKAGVIPNISGTTTSQYETVKQEALLAYEAGFKAPLFSRRLQVNAAAFYYDYSDKQVRVRELDPIFGLLEVGANVPKSEVYGAEGEFVARPLPGLTLSLSGTYLRSEVTSDFSTVNGLAVFNPEGYTGNFRGSRLPDTPTWTGTADVNYDFDLPRDLKGFAGANLLYEGTSNDTFKTPVLLAPDFDLGAYELLDLRTGVHAENDVWKVSLFCRNCTNTYYTPSKGFGTETFYRYAGHPVTVGVTLTLRTP